MNFRIIIPTAKTTKQMDGLYQACVRGDAKRWMEIEVEIMEAYKRANWSEQCKKLK